MCERKRNTGECISPIKISSKVSLSIKQMNDYEKYFRNTYSQG